MCGLWNTMSTRTALLTLEDALAAKPSRVVGACQPRTTEAAKTHKFVITKCWIVEMFFFRLKSLDT